MKKIIKFKKNVIVFNNPKDCLSMKDHFLEKNIK